MKLTAFGRTRGWKGLLALAVSCGISFLAIAGDLNKAISFDIPAQPLSRALAAFSRQADTNVAATTEITSGKMSKAVKETTTATGAMKRLLEGTGLQYRVREDGAIVLEAPETVAEAVPVRISEVNAKADSSLPASNASEEQKEQVVEEPSGKLQEIVVTAQKREERLIDVPLSITAITAEDIDRRGLVNAEDYLRGVPGVNQVESSLSHAIVIRGMETSPAFQNYYSGVTVATYFGETPTTNSAGLASGSNVDLKLVDIERVEVLRGPQGTAFGSSSMGGAVRTIPVAPKLDHFEGKVAAGFSGTDGTGGDNYNVQAVGNLPLIKDKLAIRATAYRYEDSGFYRNVAGSDAAFRATVVTPFGAEAFATDEEEVGTYYVLGGRIAALFQPSDDLRFTLSYLSQKTETDGSPVATSGARTYEQTLLQVAPEHVIRGQAGGLSDTDIDLVNVMMEYDFGWADLLATYSYIKSGSTQSYPYSSLGFNLPVSVGVNSDHREHVGEIRLATRFDGAWNFLAGLYAEDLEDDYVSDSFWHGDPDTNFFGVGQRFLGVFLDERNLKQKAAFGEASWELLEGLTFTGGIRAYEYDRTFLNDASGVPFFGPDGVHLLADTKASGENFRANLSYKLDDGALLYAGWSQGFRLGQLQGGVPPGVCDLDSDGIVDGTNITIESTRSVSSDNVNSYELGGKFALLDRRLRIDAAVFRMEWSDMPVTVRAGEFTAGGCGRVYLANAGEALSEGVELQANFRIAEPFRVDFGGSWVHARLTEDVSALNASKGNRLPGAPEINANLGLQYDFEIGGYKSSVRADAIYVGDFYGDLQHTANTKSGDYVKLDASARAEIGNLNIDLYVRNLTNEDAFTFRGTSAFIGEFFGYRLRPRTFGLQLAYTF